MLEAEPAAATQDAAGEVPDEGQEPQDEETKNAKNEEDEKCGEKVDLEKKVKPHRVSVRSLGAEKFRQRIGMLAPTTPLVLLFTNRADDGKILNRTLEAMSEKFKMALFMKAFLEKNEHAMKKFDITDSPTWIAFKNNVPVGRVVGRNADEVEELARLIYDITERETSELSTEEEESSSGGFFARYCSWLFNFSIF